MVQELYDVEHFAIKTVAVTFWRLPVIFLVMFIVRGQPLFVAFTHNCHNNTNNGDDKFAFQLMMS